MVSRFFQFSKWRFFHVRSIASTELLTFELYFDVQQAAIIKKKTNLKEAKNKFTLFGNFEELKSFVPRIYLFFIQKG